MPYEINTTTITDPTRRSIPNPLSSNCSMKMRSSPLSASRKTSPLINEPNPNKNYRVDCREVKTELRRFLADDFPGATFAFLEDPSWTWRDNGTHEERL